MSGETEKLIRIEGLIFSYHHEDGTVADTVIDNVSFDIEKRLLYSHNRKKRIW